MRLPSANRVTAAAALLTLVLAVGFILAGGAPSASPADEPGPASPRAKGPPSATPPPPPPQPGAPPPIKNLQFFPKDTPRPELIQTMRQFSFALGVRCDHCHVDEEGPGGREDFASDEKPAKVKARAMLRMTRQINEDLLARIPDRSNPPVTVGCVTCHHGLPKPETLTARLRAAATAGGADSAVAELKHLRDAAELGRFDVSELGVTEAARTLAGEGKTREALALLTANAGFHPRSTNVPLAMAEVHAAAGDSAAAVEILRQVLAKEPDNRRAKQMLERLEGKAKP